jgi:hypothetical protein
VSKFFSEPTVRLFLRALLVAGVTFATKFVDTSGHVTYSAAAVHAALVGAGLAFAEVFTPLNSLVGVFKGGSTVTPKQATTYQPAAAVTPPVRRSHAKKPA